MTLKSVEKGFISFHFQNQTSEYVRHLEFAYVNCTL